MRGLIFSSVLVVRHNGDQTIGEMPLFLIVCS